MLEDFQYDHPSKIFHGVRFALLGFDPITKSNVSSKLVDGGGVDVGQYGPMCTHLIVHNLIYDDPICVVARNDGKALVTGLWVAHSLELGMPVDPTSVLYRPLIDFKGIPGAKSLVVCLTGYLRQDRDDIMTMVHLMGANFSKPLVANKVTHLVCYKFEGEKYELAKKTKKINLVNHLWLEDCLKAWELLPEAEYNRSGYELELEAEAKDSEEEMDIATKPLQPFNPKQELQRNVHDSSASKNVSHVISTNNDMAFYAGNDRKPDQELNAPKVIDTRDSAAFRDVSCGEGAKSCERTAAASMANGLPFSARSERSLHSDASKLSPKTYLRTPRETTPTMYLGEMTGKLNTVQIVNAGKSNVSCFEISSMTEKLTDETDFGLKILKESVLHHEKQSSLLDEKKNMYISFGSSKSQKGGLDLDAHISEGAVEMNESDKLKPNLLISDTVEVNKCLSNNVTPFTSLTAAMSSPNISLAEVSKYQSSSASKKLPTSSSPFPLTVTSEISQDGNLEDALSAGSRKVSLASKPDNRDTTIGQEHCTGHAKMISSPQTKNTSSRSKLVEIEKSNGTSTFKSYADAHSTPPTRKMFSRRSWSEDKTHFSTNLHGFLCSNKILSEEDSSISSTLGEDIAGHEKLEKASAEVNPSTVINTETYNVSQSRNKDHQKSMTIDDETDAPEEKETEFREAVSDEKCKNVLPDIMVYDDRSEDLQTKKATFQVHSHSMSFGEDTITEGNNTTCGKRKLDKSVNIPKVLKSKRRGKREPLSKIKKSTIPFEASVDEEKNEFQGTVNEETCKEIESHLESVAEHKSEACNTALRVESHKISGEDRNGPKQKMTTCGKRKLGESTHVDNDLKKNAILKAKCSKIEKKIVPLSKSTNLKEAVSEEAENDKNEGCLPHLAGKVKRNESTKGFYISNEADKESIPIHTDDQNARQGKMQVRILAPIKSSSKIDMEASKPNIERGQVQISLQHEPACFILTAHKLQRKKFTQVIKRLRGKVCRDSHQWSYQATHLIVADPIRRTEKFFAAAVSGRWILKTDYLIDSSQARKFLAEEPYEWHKSGLSEDGAINMEAPRKWRLNREKTGHGAFHGMNIVIYGECIAPSLDTLKRVLKAGEGKILATSPPYTRFLKSKVDFAVVSPGIPHVDIWIQEFLRHEIPCVVADYLVEFVCKPGHTLDRHVLYNSHALAEESLKNLMNRSEASNETPPSHVGDCEQPSVKVMTPPNDSDIQCQVCGSRDRGDEMLICGDDSGSNGCGVGMHFDCCVPPMADVPVDDWFCPNCSKSKNSKKISKTAKKRTLV